MHGCVAGLAEDSIFLRGADICKGNKELHIIKDGELALTMYFEDEEDVEFWLEGLSCAVRVSENLPKLFSVHTREIHKKNEEVSLAQLAQQNMSKLLSLKRRELTAVEEKAQGYQMVADQRQQEVRELQEQLSTYAVLASQKEEENERLRLEVAEKDEKSKMERQRQDRMELETTAASTEDVAKYLDSAVDFASDGSATHSKDKGGLSGSRHSQCAQMAKNQKMEEVQKRLLAMQKLLEQSETSSSHPRKARHSIPATLKNLNSETGIQAPLSASRTWSFKLAWNLRAHRRSQQLWIHWFWEVCLGSLPWHKPGLVSPKNQRNNAEKPTPHAVERPPVSCQVPSCQVKLSNPKAWENKKDVTKWLLV